MAQRIGDADVIRELASYVHKVVFWRDASNLAGRRRFRGQDKDRAVAEHYLFVRREAAKLADETPVDKYLIAGGEPRYQQRDGPLRLRKLDLESIPGHAGITLVALLPPALVPA